jgi:hypothetical protein
MPDRSLLHIQHYMPVDIGAVIDHFVPVKNRKMNFIQSKI